MIKKSKFYWLSFFKSLSFLAIVGGFFALIGIRYLIDNAWAKAYLFNNVPGLEDVTLGTAVIVFIGFAFIITIGYFVFRKN